MKKDEEIEESWNRKRVVGAIIILAVIIGGLFYMLNNNFHFYKPQATKVLSAKDVKLEDVVQNQITALKKQAASIDVDKIASSSPEVRKLIDDLKALGNLPKNQAKEACFRICDGL